MSISHKAFLFDHTNFDAELAGVLHAALETDDVGGLRRLILDNRHVLLDLWTEAPPADDWEARIEPAYRVQQFADLAMTKYYDPRDDRGLGHGFDAPGAYLETVPGLGGWSSALYCGWLFGPSGRRLDPGSMGTGLVSVAQVGEAVRLTDGLAWPPAPGPTDPVYRGCYYGPASAAAVSADRDRLLELYRDAAAARMGLLLSDYNDRGVGRM